MATISKRGSGWFAQVRRKGYPAQYKTFRLKADALAWARKHEGVMDAGTVTQGELSLKGMTLRSILDRYIAEVTPTKRSADSEKIRLKKMQLDPLCDLDLASLKPHAIASYRDRRLVTVKPGTIRRELSLLHHAIDVARREWAYPIAINPVSLVTAPALNNARDRRLRCGELDRLESASLTCRNDLVRPIILFAIETALRRAEIVNLDWRHVHLENRTVSCCRSHGHEVRLH